MSLPPRRAVALLCLLLSAGCGPRPAAPGATGTDTDARSAAPSILASCCPETDGAIYALIDRYERTPPAERPPELAVLHYRFWSGLRERERLVIRDDASWAALWPRIVGTHRPMPPLPRVDFSAEMLVVASMGTRPSTGYLIVIDGVSAAQGALRVAVRERSPGARCATGAALTSPLALARLERSELPVTFVERTTVHDCQ